MWQTRANGSDPRRREYAGKPSPANSITRWYSQFLWISQKYIYVVKYSIVFRENIYAVIHLTQVRSIRR